MDQSLQNMVNSYYKMFEAKHLDLIEQSFTERGEAFFHVSGRGHESVAFLNTFLKKEDYLACHYRDKALMLSRGVDSKTFLLSLFNKKGSASDGRQMNAHPHDVDLNILTAPGPVGNNAPHAVGVAKQMKNHPAKPIVYLGYGEGSTAQGEFLEALNYCSIEATPVLWVIQDNNFAISTSTKNKTFYENNGQKYHQFGSVPITYVDGHDFDGVYKTFETVTTQMRKDRRSQIIVLKVQRLNSHTNADNHHVYRNEDEISKMQNDNDPVLLLRTHLLSQGIDASTLDKKEEEIQASLKEKVYVAQRAEEPEATFTAKKPLTGRLLNKKNEYTGSGSEKNVTMLEAIRKTLDYQLNKNDAVVLLGEDIEDPKGDVFGVTKGLSTKYGTDRVTNSLLSESLIVGMGIGQSMVGAKPVVFLQFADFMPLAMNQLFSELGTIFWRSNGDWECPVIVMVTMGGYKPGLGPFHANSLEGWVTHIPGVDVYLPSAAGDAAGLLNAAFESERPSVFFYPKSALNDRDKSTSDDIEKHFVAPAAARQINTGEHITLVSYGNTVKLCEDVIKALKPYGVGVDLFDLRSLSPWDETAIIQSVEKTGRLVMVHEDIGNTGFGAEVTATIAEKVKGRSLDVRRVTRDDVHVPCNFGNQLDILPSRKRILETIVSMLGGSVEWQKKALRTDGLIEVKAMGSSPSDESIIIQEWLVNVGDTIEAGQKIAEAEADKSAMSIESPVSGLVKEILLEPYEMYKVGSVALLISGESEELDIIETITSENFEEPIIKDLLLDAVKTTQESVSSDLVPSIVAVTSKKGSEAITNKDIFERSSAWASEAEIMKAAGIETRWKANDTENVVSLASNATLKLLLDNNLSLDDIDLIICATGTPDFPTPSVAARIQHSVKEAMQSESLCAAYDISAACGGYLYGLEIAYNYLSHPKRNNSRVLLVTSEVLSDRFDMNDKQTSAIFSDAATATLIVGGGLSQKGEFALQMPVIGADGEKGDILFVPNGSDGKNIVMDGVKVFLDAQKYMISYLQKALDKSMLKLDDLDLIVAHQANQRILSAIEKRLKLRAGVMYSNIKDHGNSSSSTIPLCLEQVFAEDSTEINKIGLTAFGGGYTFGGGVLTRIS